MSQVPTRFTTPLLEVITQQAMDADYEVVAAQPERVESARSRQRRHVAALLVVVLFGLLLAIAAVQTGRNASVVSEGRKQLVSRIEARRQVVADQQSRIADLRSSRTADAAANRALGEQLATVEAERDSLAATTGWAAVSGPGIRAVVTDNALTGDGGLVHDSDLALLSDALWQGGASAISVNGLRLTALSSFRNSADVIRLNGVSLSPPYVVIALGSAADLEAAVEQSSAGKSFATVVRTVGIGFTMQNETDLEAPAASLAQLRLRYATASDDSTTTATKGAQK
jgi:uncharacterized protein YlxW (UPF0749 family)